MCIVENLFRVFLSEQPLIHLWVMRIYIVWVKGREVTLKKALLVRHLQKRQPGMTLQLLVMCSSRGSFVTQLLASFSRNPLILHLSLSLHQLNTKPNTIKSHKVQGYRLKQLHHFLSWNKANIKHNCKSQLYNLPIQLFCDKTPYNRLQT